jgi:hypothetical protein
MRLAVVLVVAAAIAACGPAPSVNGPVPDLGPLPVVTALYDSGPLPGTAEEAEVWFTRDLAAAIVADKGNPVDFRYQSASPDIDLLSFGIGDTEATRVSIAVRFVQEPSNVGRIITYDMCRRADGEWRIQEVTGQGAGDAPDVLDPPVSLRTRLAMTEQLGPCV